MLFGFLLNIKEQTCLNRCLGGEHVALHALEVVLPLLGRLPVLVQPLLALLALHEERHLAAVLVLPRQVAGHEGGSVRLPQPLDLVLLGGDSMEKIITYIYFDLRFLTLRKLRKMGSLYMNWIPAS